MKIDIGNKYIHAEPMGMINRKPAFTIVNNKSGKEIACICYYQTWKKYTMVTAPPAIFDVDCLESIIKFIKEQTEGQIAVL